MNHEVEKSDGERRLPHLPVSIFSTIMGLSGFTIAWQRAHAIFGVTDWLWKILASVTAAGFLLLLIAYGMKLARHFPQVVAEWKHPVRVSFFPTISISFLLMGLVCLETWPSVSYCLWLCGTLLHFAFTLAILGSWMNHTHYDIKHAHPGWFIPVVGNLFVPICALHFGLPEVGWFFFSIGIVFWVVMMTIVLYRIFFHDPVPPKLLPTLSILIAPPAVGFIAYSALIPGIDAFARVLYYTGLFMTLLLGMSIRRFMKCGFYISSWAYSFPLAAITIASFLMGKRSGSASFDGLALVLLCILSVLIGVLLWKTLNAAGRKAICVPE